MATARKVTVISSQRNGAVEFTTDATNWEQLKNTISNDLGDVCNMAATIKETRNSLSAPNALLPEGEFTLYLTPQKIRAGVPTIESVQQVWNDKITNIFAASSNAKEVEVSNEDKAILAELMATL